MIPGSMSTAKFVGVDHFDFVHVETEQFHIPACPAPLVAKMGLTLVLGAAAGMSSCGISSALDG